MLKQFFDISDFQNCSEAVFRPTLKTMVESSDIEIIIKYYSVVSIKRACSLNYFEGSPDIF